MKKITVKKTSNMSVLERFNASLDEKQQLVSISRQNAESEIRTQKNVICENSQKEVIKQLAVVGEEYSLTLLMKLKKIHNNNMDKLKEMNSEFEREFKGFTKSPLTKF